MATNSLPGCSIDQIAMESLDYLSEKMARLDIFFTDFSPNIAFAGDNVTTRYPVMGTASKKETAAERETAVNATTIARNVVLNVPYGITYEFTEREVIKSPIDLVNLFMKPAIDAVANHIFATAMSVYTIADFPDEYDIDPNNTRVTQLMALNALLGMKKVPDGNRFLLLQDAPYYSLMSDPALIVIDNAGQNVAINTRGQIDSSQLIKGFNIHRATTLPDNGRAMLGVAGAKQSAIMAARAIPDPNTYGPWFGESVNMVCPKTGMPTQLRRWYDGAKWKFCYMYMAGFAPGNTDNAIVLTQAA